MTVVSQARSPRTSHDVRRHHQRGVAGLVGEAEAAEATSPVPGSSTSSRTTARAVVSRHHLSASAKRVAPAVREPGGPAPAHQALAAAYPRDGVLGRQQVDQGAEVVAVQRYGADDQWGFEESSGLVGV